jgi:hypothetical protein
VVVKIGSDDRRAAAPFLMRRTPLTQERFTLWGESYDYLVHRYNTTGLNERCVEVPAHRFVSQVSGRGMELRNVLGHYGITGQWKVVDKYERGVNVCNVDIVNCGPSTPLDSSCPPPPWSTSDGTSGPGSPTKCSMPLTTFAVS